MLRPGLIALLCALTVGAAGLLVPAAGGAAASVRLTLGLWAVPALIGAAVWLPQLRFRTLPAGPLAVSVNRWVAECTATGRPVRAVLGFCAVLVFTGYVVLRRFRILP